MTLVPEVHNEIRQALEARQTARRRRWRTRPVVAAVAALTVTGTATAAVVVQSGNDVPMSAQRPISTRALRALTSADAVDLTVPQRRLVQNDLVADYGLQPDRARAVPSPDTRPGHHGRWVIVPGRRGLCVAYGSGSFCTPTSSFEAGLALSTREPAPRIINRADVQGGATPKISSAQSAGPGSVKGVVPDAVTSVVAINRDGTAIASAPVANNVYDLRLPDFQQMQRLEVRAGDRISGVQTFR